MTGTFVSWYAWLIILPKPGILSSPHNTSDIMETFIPNPKDWTIPNKIYGHAIGITTLVKAFPVLSPESSFKASNSVLSMFLTPDTTASYKIGNINKKSIINKPLVGFVNIINTKITAAVGMVLKTTTKGLRILLNVDERPPKTPIIKAARNERAKATISRYKVPPIAFQVCVLLKSSPKTINVLMGPGNKVLLIIKAKIHQIKKTKITPKVVKIIFL